MPSTLPKHVKSVVLISQTRTGRPKLITPRTDRQLFGELPSIQILQLPNYALMWPGTVEEDILPIFEEIQYP